MNKSAHKIIIMEWEKKKSENKTNRKKLSIRKNWNIDHKQFYDIFLKYNEKNT